MLNCKYVVQTVMFVFFMSSSISAHSQQKQAAAINIGETRFYPSVNVTFENSDNTYLAVSDQEEDASTFIVAPKFDWVADRRLLTVKGTYAGAYASSSESNLNYSDHDLQISADTAISKRNNIRARLYLQQGHEVFGTGFTSVEDVAQRSQTVNNEIGSVIRYTYGAAGARGNLILGLDLVDRSFKDQPDLTRGRDFFKMQANAIFSLRLSPESRFLFEARLASFDYDNNNLDRDDTSFLVGARFKPTSKSGGVVKLGVTNNNFAIDSVTDTSFGILEVDLFYSLRTYSRLTIGADRRFDSDEAVDGLAINVESIRESANIGWQHDWSSRVSTIATLTSVATKRECPSNSNSNTTTGLTVRYKTSRWLGFSVGARRLLRSRQLCTADSDLDAEKLTLSLSVSATL